MLGIVYLLTVLLFLLILLSLGFQPKIIGRMTGLLLFLTTAAGMLLYGWGFWALEQSVGQATVRTLFAVFCMFLGRNEIGAISAVPPLDTPFAQVVLYLIHLLALYCTASAVVQTIGVRLVRTLHLLLMRRGDLNLIYGVNAHTLAFAGELIGDAAGTVVFADGDAGNDDELRCLKIGSLLFSDADAAAPNPAFLRRLGVGGRQMTLYCLHDSPAENLRYAAAMRDALQKAGIDPARTALTAMLPDGAAGAFLQNGGEHYGYGSVSAAEPAELLARLLIRTAPPYRTLSFDETGRATEDFEALIVGFGKRGQAVLRALVQNGQFAGSHFRAVVVAKNYRDQAGSFFSRYPALCDEYDVTFLDLDARGVELYRAVAERGRRLKYAVLCAGSEKENGEIALELGELFRRLKITAPILQCAPNGIRVSAADGTSSTAAAVYTTGILCGELLDERAKLLNHQYHLAEGHTAGEDWAACDYFSRLSCRAAADFADALLFAAGTDSDTVRREGFSPAPALLETLAETEHLRWCAFHAAAGYRTMPEETWEARAAQYRADVETTGASSIRIGKDTERRLHACLVGWEALDALSARENAVTGGRVDYKEMDRDNVRMIPAILRESDGKGR